MAVCSYARMSFRQDITRPSDMPDGNLVTAPALIKGKTSRKMTRCGADRIAPALPLVHTSCDRPVGKVPNAFRGHWLPSGNAVMVPAPPEFAVQNHNRGTIPAKLNGGASIDNVTGRATHELERFAR